MTDTQALALGIFFCALIALVILLADAEPHQ